MGADISGKEGSRSNTGKVDVVDVTIVSTQAELQTSRKSETNTPNIPNKVRKDGLGDIIEELKFLRKQVTDALALVERTSNLVYMGFLGLLVVVFGLFFSYFEYVSEGSLVKAYRETTEKSLMGNASATEKLMEENESLRKQIRSCLRKNNYWEYKQCLGDI